METLHEQEKVISIPRIGDKAPEFRAVTTQGIVNFPGDYKGKWAILLALTSNKGSQDFQHIQENNEKLYELVVRKSFDWGNEDNIMFVTGATHPEELGGIRKLAPRSFFLVPGVGAQGGDLAAVVKAGRNEEIGLLVNSSRGIIYASSDEGFDKAARKEAQKLSDQMGRYF